MRCRTIVIALVCGVAGLSVPASPRNRRPPASPPQEFEIGRHTFFDFGPPSDFYELFLVRTTGNDTSIERITLTPAGGCTQPAKVETASGKINAPIATLFGKTNPCAIPEKALRRELKRCKKCLVFSGADVAMQVQCGSTTRIIRSDILDKDMFDPAANTPEHTSWTMQLLGRIDQAVGPGAMDRPIFPVSEPEASPSPNLSSNALRDVNSGKYDLLFQKAPNKASDIYRAAQISPPKPSVQLVSSTPFQPQVIGMPAYPPLARAARIEGVVTFNIEIAPDGGTTNFIVDSGHPMLRETVKRAVAEWRFPKEAAGQKVQASIGFKTNCPK